MNQPARPISCALITSICSFLEQSSPSESTIPYEQLVLCSSNWRWPSLSGRSPSARPTESRRTSGWATWSWTVRRHTATGRRRYGPENAVPSCDPSPPRRSDSTRRLLYLPPASTDSCGTNNWIEGGHLPDAASIFDGRGRRPVPRWRQRWSSKRRSNRRSSEDSRMAGGTGTPLRVDILLQKYIKENIL